MNPKERDRRIGTVMLSAAAFWVAELAAFRQFLAGSWGWDWVVHATLPDAAILAAAAAVLLLSGLDAEESCRGPGIAPVLDVLRSAGGNMLASGGRGQLSAHRAGPFGDGQHAPGTFERHSGRCFGRSPVYALLRRAVFLERGGDPVSPRSAAPPYGHAVRCRMRGTGEVKERNQHGALDL